MRGFAEGERGREGEREEEIVPFVDEALLANVLEARSSYVGALS